MAGLQGILAGAVGGAAGAAQDMAGGYIRDERQVNVQQQLSQIEEERQMRIAEATETRRRAGRQADFEQNVTNAPRENQMAIDKENSQLNFETNPETIQKRNAVDTARTQKLSPGEEVTQGGKVIASNKRITMPEAYQYGFRQSPGAGKETQHSQEAWAKAFDDAKEDFKVEDPLSGKAQDVQGARAYYRSRFNEMRREPGADPIDVRTRAGEETASLLYTAKRMVASPKGIQQKLTIDDAVDYLVQQQRAARVPKAPAPPATSAPAGTGTPPGEPKGILESEAPPEPGGQDVSKLGTFQLQNIADSPRTPPGTRAAARKELAKRKAQQLQAVPEWPQMSQD